MDKEFQQQDRNSTEAEPDVIQPAQLTEEALPPEEKQALQPQEAAQTADGDGATETKEEKPHYQTAQEPPHYEPAPQTGKKSKKKKKERRGLTILQFICFGLVCAILGGALGAGGTALIGGITRAVIQGVGTVNILQGDRPSTVIQVNEIDTSKALTPAQVYAKNVNSTVGITTSVTTNYWGYTTTSAASGSGFIYSEDGYILTNFHVIENSHAVTVSFYDGTSMPATVVGYDESNDIAVLKVEAQDLPAVTVGDSSNMNVGDTVVAIGNPLGELTFSLTAGAVSALDREVTLSGGVTMNLIQTDCAINSGNSGGALFNLYGEVIGITNAKYSGTSGGGASIDNIGFAIPMNRVRTIVDSIIEKGYVVKPYIGVSVSDVSQETQSYGLPEGASVRSITEGSPAEKAGLQPNDIITHVNGQQITGASDLKMLVSNATPGDVLQLKLWRKGAVIELELTVGEQIQEAVQPQAPVQPITPWG